MKRRRSSRHVVYGELHDTSEGYLKLANGRSTLKRPAVERGTYWHPREDCLSWRIGQLAGVKLTLPENCRISAVDPYRTWNPPCHLSRHTNVSKKALSRR